MKRVQCIRCRKDCKGWDPLKLIRCLDFKPRIESGGPEIDPEKVDIEGLKKALEGLRHEK